MHRNFVISLVVLWLATSWGALDGRADDPPTTDAPHTNRLAKESSPYLLLHAHNPVEWFPWGEEALVKAKAENKPIFLSVGYSSCHWCHVMERESFMDQEIAAFLNQHFVAIKVDREERPDIDEIYMRSLQIYLQMAGAKQGGGWPLSMFLTPDAKPIVGGSYFPPRDKPNQTGFLTVLTRVHEAWTNDRERWQATGDALAEFVASSLEQRPIKAVLKIEQPVLDKMMRALTTQFDSTYGGFGFDATNPRMPKFPEPPNLNFLIEQAHARNSQGAKDMLVTTLDKVAQGGIRDHLGGGFHRYSTDRYWRVPHFEKTLYDNAQLASIYAQAHELTGNAEYRAVVDETLGFLLRELAAPTGGFYAALDAETDGKEGLYYVWRREEVEPLLSADEFALYASVFGLTGEANFEDRHILLLSRSLTDEAKSRQLDLDRFRALLQPIQSKLLAARQQRSRPLVDTKILTSWNGLAIRGLADAGRLLKHEPYTEAARKTAEFVLANLRSPDGRLWHTYTGGQAKLPAYLDDYALLIDGLLALHQASGDERWLKAAGDLMKTQIALFSDERAGGFFYTARDHEVLIVRSKLAMDNVTPSGNSASAANLLALAAALDKPEYMRLVSGCFSSASPLLDEQPLTVPQMGVAVSRWIDRTRENTPARGK